MGGTKVMKINWGDYILTDNKFLVSRADLSSTPAIGSIRAVITVVSVRPPRTIGTVSTDTTL